jgi:hypothetical protein
VTCFLSASSAVFVMIMRQWSYLWLVEVGNLILFVTQVHFEKKVNPTYTQVFWDRGRFTGVVEFDNKDDVDLAVRELDGTEFKIESVAEYIRVVDISDERAQESGSRSRCATGIARPRSLAVSEVLSTHRGTVSSWGN